MKLKVIRQPSGEKATLGEMLIDGAHECYTLEDVVREVPDVSVADWKIPGATAIPRGTYDVAINFSSRFQRELPLLLNVPGFTGVRIHPGNTDADTHGCILVGGKPTSPDFIPNSRATFQTLFNKMLHAESIGETITVEVV